MSLICNGSHGLDVVRMNNFKPDLHKDCIGLCAENKPIKNSLFWELNEGLKLRRRLPEILINLRSNLHSTLIDELFYGRRVSNTERSQGKPLETPHKVQQQLWKLQKQLEYMLSCEYKTRKHNEN